MKVLIVVLVVLIVALWLYQRGQAKPSQDPPPRKPLDAAAVAEIDRLVLAGNKIQAIKLLRERTDLGLKEAKIRIELWQPGSPPPTSLGGALEPAAIELPPHVRDEVTRLVATDQKIQAIKLVRQHTGLGLKDAKDVVDGWR